MSTTPLISSKSRIPYTVVGGAKIVRVRRATNDVSILVMNRGGRFFRNELFHQIQDLGRHEILFIEGPQIPYDIEPLSRQYPRIRFLLLHAEASAGEKVNLGIEEARSAKVIVAWSDMKISPSCIDKSVLARIEKQQTLCTVPLLRNSGAETIPSMQTPVLTKGKLKMIPWNPIKEGMKSLFPFDYCGIYLKDKFQLSGGFDPKLSNPYWQKMDFGFRVFLWGEDIRCDPDFHMSYSVELIAEDSTPDASYKLFFLKNLAVRLFGEAGAIPYTQLPRYLLRSDSNWFHSIGEFRQVRRWVNLHRHRFKYDVQRLLKQWETPV